MKVATIITLVEQGNMDTKDNGKSTSIHGKII